jgi:hypothetical protein
MYDLGAKYWNVDGAIVPWQHAEAAKMWAADHGMELREKSDVGFAHIKWVGAYSLPGLTTKNFVGARDREHFSLPPREICDHAIKVFSSLT